MSGGAHAAGLPALIREATSGDPAVLQARANEEVAAARLAATRAERLPVLGVQASADMARPGYAQATPFRGVTGRLNLYSAGSVKAAIERDLTRTQLQQFKTAEMRETVALNVADLFLQALRAQELLQAEQRNIERHERIVADLRVIVDNDGGRRYELVQAEARALQVRTRMAQHERTMRLALSKLTRYTRQSPTLSNPIAPDWARGLSADVAERIHPSLAAQRREADALRADQTRLSRARWPRLDLEAGAGNHGYARVVLNWSFFDRGADHGVQAAAKQIAAAEQQLDWLERDLAERGATAAADMAQSQFQIEAAERQIGASVQVVELYELQFKIGRRSLIELVNAYAELAAVEVSRVTAQNDWRAAVVSSLHAQAALAHWAQAQP